MREKFLRIADQGLSGLDIPSLFKLYHLDLLSGIWRIDEIIIKEIKGRQITKETMTSLIKDNQTDFPTHALLCYSGYDFRSDLSMLQHLLELGVDVNSTDQEGKTALHRAICIDHECNDTVKFLIAHGADFDKPDQNGKTTINYLERLLISPERIQKLFGLAKDYTHSLRQVCKQGSAQFLQLYCNVQVGKLAMQLVRSC